MKAIAAPFVGLAYVVLLPFIGLGMLTVALVEKAGEPLVRYAAFGWQPVKAFLMGRKRRK